MPGLTVLLTNHTLGDRGGSDLFVRDVATSLLARGHRPVVYSPLLGSVAEALRIATVPVTSDLDSLAERPDIIHGQHHLEARIADARATIGDMERSPFRRARKMWMALRDRRPGPR
jgi:hypothetical protein